MVVQAFGLQKDLVAIAFGEAHHLVLDRGAIARPRALDLAGVDRRPVEVRQDQRVALGARVGDVAIDLRPRDRFRQIGEGLRRVVARLALEAVIVDGPAVQPRRRTGLQPAGREAEPSQRRGQGARRPLADTAGRPSLFANMDDAAQERARRQNHGAGQKALPGLRDHPPAAAAVVQDQVLGGAGMNPQARLFGENGLNRLAVELAVGLRTGAANSRPPTAVEHAELDPGAVDGAAHDAVQGVDLAHEVALAQPADRRVAGHHADGLGLVGQQQGPGAEPGRRRRGLAAGMAAADHDHVMTGHGRRDRRAGRRSQNFPCRGAPFAPSDCARYDVSRETCTEVVQDNIGPPARPDGGFPGAGRSGLLADAEVPEDHIQNILHIDLARQPA